MEDESETVCQSEDDRLQQNIDDFLTNAEVKDVANISFDDIVGLHDVKEKLKEFIILPIKFPRLIQGKRKRQHILMYGAPGVGKTMLVQAVISELLKEDTLCFRCSVYDFLSRLNTSPTGCLSALFTRASGQNQSMVMIEDVEVLSKEGDARIHDLNESLSFHTNQGLEKDNDSGFHYVIYVTNKPWKLSTSVTRRVDSYIYVPLPNNTDSLDILKLNMKSVRNDLTDAQFSSVGDLMKGFTGSDIVIAARDACMHPIRRVQHATHFKKVSGSPDHDPGTRSDDLLTPCTPDDVGAMEMAWTDIPSTKLCPQPVCLDDIRKSLSDMKSSLTEEERLKFETFHDTKD